MLCVMVSKLSCVWCLIRCSAGVDAGLLPVDGPGQPEDGAGGRGEEGGEGGGPHQAGRGRPGRPAVHRPPQPALHHHLGGVREGDVGGRGLHSELCRALHSLARRPAPLRLAVGGGLAGELNHALLHKVSSFLC